MSDNKESGDRSPGGRPTGEQNKSRGESESGQDKPRPSARPKIGDSRPAARPEIGDSRPAPEVLDQGTSESASGLASTGDRKEGGRRRRRRRGGRGRGGGQKSGRQQDSKNTRSRSPVEGVGGTSVPQLDEKNPPTTPGPRATRQANRALPHVCQCRRRCDAGSDPRRASAD